MHFLTVLHVSSDYIVATVYTVYAPKGTTMNIYIISPVHPFIGCGDRVDTIYTHWNTSKFVLYVCGMLYCLLSVTSFMRRVGCSVY